MFQRKSRLMIQNKSVKLKSRDQDGEIRIDKNFFTVPLLLTVDALKGKVKILFYSFKTTDVSHSGGEI